MYEFIEPIPVPNYIGFKDLVFFPTTKRFAPSIKKVIFNDKATIVIWEDGVKTVVKCMEGEPYDKEKGMAMAIAKRVLGNKDGWYSEIKKWVYKNDKR